MTTLDTQPILNALRSIIGGAKSPISLHEPVFGSKEIAYTTECIETGWVSSVGKFVNRFEQILESYTGVNHAVATVNGTAALHICLKLAGVEPGDEVLVPALTFVATANAVTYCHATPHFVDSDLATLGVCPRKLESYLARITRQDAGITVNKKTGRPIRALVAMHAFGHALDLDPLVEVCKKYGIILIEDAAESLGTLYKGKHTGHWGTLSALSFNGNKIVTTGGGGAILTNDSALAKRAKHLTTTAKVAHPWSFVHDEIGYNYRLPNLNAALGCAQLEQLEDFLERKRRLAHRYEEAFRGVLGVRFFKEPSFSKSNYWLNAVLLEPEFASQRDRLLEATHATGILARPVWTLMSRLAPFQGCPADDLSVAEDIESRLINIPSGAALSPARPSLEDL